MNWYDFIASPLWVSKPSLWLVGALCVLLVVPLSKVFISFKLSTAWRIIIYAASSLLLTWIFLGDAYKASLQYNKYCREESGMHVYRTVENVVSFAADSGSVAAGSLYRGYSFSEYEDVGNKLFRVSGEGVELIKGRVKGFNKKEIYHFESKYYIYDKSKILSEQIKKKNRIIEVRETKEVLEELINFYYYPGWMDRKIWGWLGDYTPPRCDTENHIWGLYKKVLIPVQIVTD
ncbi:MAG: hypothetical protein COA46_06035 [Porticoccaceae bacterium]|nr:MAG: hypothetical protein COA46_06035 [Porticoccaceae bacterium]